MDTDNLLKKKCSFCGEDVAANSRRCPYCGSSFEAKFNTLEQEDFKVDKVPSEEAVLQDSCSSNESIGESVEGKAPEVKDRPAENTGNVAYSQPQKQEVFKSVRTGQYTNNNSFTGSENKKSLSNGIKVLLTVIATAIPGLGQLIGVIAAIVFMNSDDRDKKSFGIALLVASLVLFVLSCIFYFIFGIFLISYTSY
ncbi:MAG: zinc ribbon domain-containing protein [Clostridia bacterium]|nr:zinc ribbon domain-containing protein [Clostridia bacterium]